MTTAAPFDDSSYKIPGGALCTVCGLRYYSMSVGGPGICPSCDCGNFGFQVVEAQRKEIDALRARIAELERGEG